LPELPECETVVRSIRPHIWGCKIIRFILAEGQSLDVDGEEVKDQTIRHVGRMGKYIIFKLDRGYLVSHLRMTGQWLFVNKDYPAPTADKHFRWAFTIRGHDGNFIGHLWFKDVRKFGTMVWVDSLSDFEPFSRLGPDGLNLDDPKEVFKIIQAAKKSRRPVKNFLLDQAVIAGCGNIYASEALFRSRLSPKIPTRDLESEQITTLCAHLYEIFKKSVDLGGSSVSDYAGGRYQDVLQVYGRNKEPCFECSTLIERITQAGRSTFFCPTCQREEENELF
jgi:formamidopyrimidine-DNA glycosylase